MSLLPTRTTMPLSDADRDLLLRIATALERLADYVTAQSSDASDVTVESVDDVALEVVRNESHGLRAPGDTAPEEPEDFIGGSNGHHANHANHANSY